MVEKGYVVVWTKRSQKQMRQVFKHISTPHQHGTAEILIYFLELHPSYSDASRALLVIIFPLTPPVPADGRWKADRSRR